MKTEKQIDLVEDAMKRAYNGESVLHNLSPDWESSLMAAIKDGYSPEDFETEKLETKFLHFSWFAAGVAASLIFVSCIIYAMQPDEMEKELQDLYADYSDNNLIMAMADQ